MQRKEVPKWGMGAAFESLGGSQDVQWGELLSSFRVEL